MLDPAQPNDTFGGLCAGPLFAESCVFRSHISSLSGAISVFSSPGEPRIRSLKVRQRAILHCLRFLPTDDRLDYVRPKTADCAVGKVFASSHLQRDIVHVFFFFLSGVGDCAFRAEPSVASKKVLGCPVCFSNCFLSSRRVKELMVSLLEYICGPSAGIIRCHV